MLEKLTNYNGSVELMAGIRQKGGGDFALIEANAVQTQENGTRLDEELQNLRAALENAAEAIPDSEIIALFSN